MSQIFNLILYQPLFNLLIFFYNIIPGHQFALAIICLTIIIRLILHRFSIQMIRNQKVMQELQGKMDEVKKRYKDNKEKQAQELTALFKREKVNPLSSCLPTLIQLPFLIAVFKVFRNGLNAKSLELLYPFISHPGTINFFFLGIDLARPSPLLAVLAGLAQFWQSKMLVTKTPPPEVRKTEGAKDESMAAIMSKQMTFMMPALTVFIGLTFPAGLTLYWLVTTLLIIVEQKYFLSASSHQASADKSLKTKS